MKKYTKLFMATCCALVSSSVLAVDGTVVLKGRVVGSSCTININSSGSSPSLGMPAVSIDALASEGAVAGNTPIRFELSGCPANSYMQVYFESNNVDPNTGYLTNKSATPAGNIEVRVLNRDSEVIDLRTNSKNYLDSSNVTDASGNVTLRYYAQYAAVGGAATAGDVESQLVYTLQYP